MDDKGRLKVPTAFRRYLEEKYGREFYVTSLTGECVRIFPLPEWETIEQRLALLPSMDPARRKFLDRTNYYGQQAELDGQGRILVHPLLRKSAGVVGDVAVLGYLTYLEVWELERFERRLLSDPYTEEDEAAIARLGILESGRRTLTSDEMRQEMDLHVHVTRRLSPFRETTGRW